METKHLGNTQQNIHNIDRDRLNALKKESTVALVRRIVEDSDRLALSVFLETRKVFWTSEEKPFLLHEYLSILHKNMSGNFRYKVPNVTTSELADRVYDKTLTKYMNMPSEVNASESADRGTMKREVDCRNYYRAFLKKIQQMMDEGEIKTQEDEEIQAGIILQKLVAGNFYSSSLKDCLRDLSPSIRYEWKVNGGRLYLWRPRHVEIAEFRKWLEAHIANVDLTRQNENQRIQRLIDRHFGSYSVIAMDEIPKKIHPDSDIIDPLESKQKQMLPVSLSRAVAREKVGSIHKLRPSIRAMGKKALEGLILNIFFDLAKNEDYELSELAKKYNISKSSLSRFAGIKWREDRDSDVKYIPDLWQNTARILAEHPIFMEIASASGFADGIKEVLESINP